MISKKIISGINGSIKIPGDKSISHRSIIIPSISKGVSEINNILMSDDVLHTLEAFKALGVEVIFITGDSSNSWLAEKRNVKTYVTRLKDGSSISKEKVLNRHLKETGIKHDEVWFAGDDVFDISAMIISKYVYRLRR